MFKRNPRGPWIVSWWGHDGRRRERNCRTTDRAAAERVLSKCTGDTALRRDGIIDAAKDRFSVEGRKPLADHVADYLAHCARKELAPRHVSQKAMHLERLQAATGATRLTDLTADALEIHLHDLRSRGLCSRTINFARQQAVTFMAWAVKTGRADRNPLSVVARLDETGDRRHVRRPLTDEDLSRLLTVAGDRGRGAWYLCAVQAGLRRGDLMRLTWSDVDFTQGTITIRNGKARREDVLPLHPQLAEVLTARKAEARALPTARVFPKGVTILTTYKDFLRAGLAKAETVIGPDGKPVMIGKGRHRRPKIRITTADADGTVIDLHAMRTTLGTNLARAGVFPQIAQKIMRHSDYKTTLKHYTVLGLTDTAKAIGRLPTIMPEERQAEPVRKLGTNNLPASTDGPDGARNARPQSQRNSQPNSAKRRDEPTGKADGGDSHKSLESADLRDTARHSAAPDRKAGEGTRTLNIQLGRLMLWPLSYTRSMTDRVPSEGGGRNRVVDPGSSRRTSGMEPEKKI